MIDAAPRLMIDRLSPVRCGRCNRPVGQMNKTIPGAEGGGMCTNCREDERGKPIRVYTYYGVIPAVDDKDRVG